MGMASQLAEKVISFVYAAESLLLMDELRFAQKDCLADSKTNTFS
jgi:hypothetical protein